MEYTDLSPRQLALLSMSISVSATVCFYLVLRQARRTDQADHAGQATRVLLALLFVLALAVPFMVPAALTAVSRFLVALFALLLAFKMWDLQMSVGRCELPRPPQFFAYLANLYLLVWRKRNVERQPTRWRNLRNLLLAILNFLGAIATIILLHRFDWSGVPFLFAHALIAICLLWLVVGELDMLVAIIRLFGAYSVEANDKPYLARTPAEFWRRYNRVIGQFLHENVFKLGNGRRHPLRATMLAFFVSGLFHEYLFWLAIGRSPGLQMTFFLLQGAAVAATLRVRPKGPSSICWWLLTWTFMLLSSVPFFTSFEHMIPVYPVPLPAWLAAW